MKYPHVVLGVPPGASKDEIRSAYRRLCLKFHPDVCPPNQKHEAERLFKEVTEAYTALSKGEGSHGVPKNYNPNGSRGGGGYQWGSFHRPRISNRVIGLMISVPLILTGVRIGMSYEKYKEESGRSDGLLYPPVNPFLRQDEHGTMQVRWGGDRRTSGKATSDDVPKNSD
ncbi:hypothetical protein BSKO_12029 [Bryopsis sp. KO-2023]|nr:hypothetical protein BSKO_12029 [Bryopsis sp. KO-2023]